MREYSSPACLLHEFEPEARAIEPPDVRIKRIYEDPDPDDGRRILIDRLWPRGVRKEHAALDEWLRDVAPSPELRKWFAHDAKKWAEFRRRYRSELVSRSAELNLLRERARHERVTLLYGARDPAINHAIVLKELLQGDSRASASTSARRRRKKALSS